MPSMLVRHKVTDYAKWKAVFDAHAPTRKANGSKGGRLFRSASDPNEVVVLLEWKSLDQARRFMQADDLRQTMQRAGVTDIPDVYFLNEVDRPTV